MFDLTIRWLFFDYVTWCGGRQIRLCVVQLGLFESLLRGRDRRERRPTEFLIKESTHIRV
jgi:hypothetical protein